MEKLKEVQDRGPVNQTPEEVNKWHNQILEAANWELRGIAPKPKIQASGAGREALGGADNKMSGEEDQGVEEQGSWDPYTKKYIPSYRKEVVDPPFVPGSGFEEPGCEGLKTGDLKPADQQPLNWNPRINGGRGGYEPAGYETKVEDGDGE